MSYAEMMGHDIPSYEDACYMSPRVPVQTRRINKKTTFKTKKKRNDRKKTIRLLSLEHETARAYLVKINNYTKAWFPKSQVKLQRSTLVIEVPVWLYYANKTRI